MVTLSTFACSTVASTNFCRRSSLLMRLMPQRALCAPCTLWPSGGPNIIRLGHHQRFTASCTMARCASVPSFIITSSASKPWRWWKLSSRQMRTIARA
jgi:hypothetical protein